MTSIDYSILDQPGISAGAFYPRPNWSASPPGAVDHGIAVDSEVSLSARFFPVSAESPVILFFYGNGETATDYNGIAPYYNRAGVNFFVADYRGYGRSGGTPTFSTMLADAHKVLDYAESTLSAGGFTGGVYVMGRSMGRHSAFELATARSERLAGVIIESGRPILGNFVQALSPQKAQELESAYKGKVASIAIPSLVIHGELDSLAPVEQAEEMYNSFSTEDKRILTIRGAGHNDLLYVGLNDYFAAIQEFTGA